MRLLLIGFAGGAWALQQQAELPAWPLSMALGFLSGLTLVVAAHARGPKRDALNACAAATAGFLWAAAFAHLAIADRLDAALEGRDVEVTGVVASLPQPFERGVRFEFDIEKAEARMPRRVLLAWYQAATPEERRQVARAGERWRFMVRLRRPHGVANPDGYDWEAAQLERGIGATGYVRAGAAAGRAYERLDAFVLRPAYVIERAREHIRSRFLQALPEAPYAGVLIALAIGDQRAIAPADWQTFVRTGVGHLMSISGLHVTMVAGLFAWLVYGSWRRAESLTLRLPARKAAAVAGVLAALAYCLLAGFAVPAQRTLYMLTVVAIALWLDRLQSSTRVLALALGVVVVLDPWAVISAGFWLSFGAVALMLYVGQQARTGAVRNWMRIQWAITVGLAPLTLVLFQQVSLVSPLANAIAIPVVSMVITPLALAAAVIPWDAIAQLAHALMAALMWFLDLLAAAPGAVWQQHAPVAWTLALAALGIAWLLAPRGIPARCAGALLLAPMFTVAPLSPAPASAWLTFLDVGQGLAVVVRTAGHALAYDTGPAYGANLDAGERVVVPFLRAAGVSALDTVIVTHRDSDHAGGAQSLLRFFPPTLLLSSLEAEHPAQALAPYRVPCYAGQSWEWDGVRFEMLHPSAQSYGERLRKTNWRSCVLRVTAFGRSVLLTGDIEERDERALLASGQVLAAEVMLAPHHGSRSSSSSAFLAAVQPSLAVFTVGYRNRFGHPADEVVARYRAQGAGILRTDETGAVQVRLEADGVRAERFRAVAPRYWR